VKDALLAIALHHAELNPGEVRRDFPELYFLIVADELQEWGRKALKAGYDMSLGRGCLIRWSSQEWNCRE
jgi:hypothetical protein